MVNNINTIDGTYLFHAGTATTGNQLVTNGGRVFTAVAEGNTVVDARDNALRLSEQITFEGKYFRKDIGHYFGH